MMLSPLFTSAKRAFEMAAIPVAVAITPKAPLIVLTLSSNSSIEGFEERV